MATKPFAGVSREYGVILERSMRNWELSKEAAQSRDTGQAPVEVQDFIAISRAVGLPGDEIARGIGERLGWPVFDRELLHAMAGDDSIRERLYQRMDERDMGWLESMLASLTADEALRDDFFHRLTETVLAIARRGHAVFLGRAADLILPRQCGLRVRIGASRRNCITRYAEANGTSIDRAAREIEEIEHDRARFIRNHFRIEPSDPTRHDLILNIERFTAPQAIDVILAAAKARGLHLE